MCAACARRAWLLEELGPALDYCARDPDRLFAALSLEDVELIAGLGGRRRHELVAAWERRGEQPRSDGCSAGAGAAICRHDPGYPRALAHPLAPCALHLSGASERFCALASGPVVAIVGSAQPSDYGVAVAASLARGLAASGVAVASTLDDGIAAAVHNGALAVGGGSVAVLGGGLQAPRPARLAGLLTRVTHTGCGVAELPHMSPTRRWTAVGAQRAAAALAQVTVLVEAGEHPRELAASRAAQALGRTVAAVPGRVTSPLSLSTNALLAHGLARMARTPEDVLDLLDLQTPQRASPGALGHTLAPRLRETLADVGAGRDTPEKLTGDAADRGEVLLRLSELELIGLLTRGDGGRYVPCEPSARW